jgi:hypothetical protein
LPVSYVYIYLDINYVTIVILWYLDYCIHKSQSQFTYSSKGQWLSAWECWCQCLARN